MEVDPADPSQRRYRVKPDVLRAGLPVDVALTTSYDVDDEHERVTRIFVGGLRVQLDRERAGRRRRARNTADD
jgi:hypothetical protein